MWYVLFSAELVVDGWEFVSIGSAPGALAYEGLSASLRQEEEAGNFAPFHSSSEPKYIM
jgi:hypothetical protein